MTDSTTFDLKKNESSTAVTPVESDSESSSSSKSSAAMDPLLMLSSLSSTILSSTQKTEEGNNEAKETEDVTPKACDVKNVSSCSPPPPPPSSETRHSHYSGRHGNWTPEEDALLLKLVAKYDTAHTKQWTYVAKMMGTGRIGKQCRDRYLNHIGPDVVKTPWTPEEDRIIILSQKLYGNSWTRIASILGNGRPANGIKNRWNSCLRHRYLKIEGDSLDAAIINGAAAAGTMLSAATSPVVARKRPSSDSIATDFPCGLELPHKMRREQTIQLPEPTSPMELCNTSVSQGSTSSAPESPKMPASPILNSVSPSRTMSPSPFPKSPCASPSAFLPNSLIWHALYSTPIVPMNSLASPAVAPSFISIRPQPNLMNGFFGSTPFIPTVFQQPQLPATIPTQVSPVGPSVSAPSSPLNN